MTSEAIVSARADIESTEDMFLRAMKLNDPAFDWQEARRIASLPDFMVRDELERLRTEVAK